MNRKKIYGMLLALMVTAWMACKKQLDVKPNSAIQVPVTATDFQALLDYPTVFTVAWPFAGTAGADEGFVTDATWSAAALTARNAYIWDRDVFNDLPRNDWSYAYTAVFYANVVLEGVGKYGGAAAEWRNIRGQAAFFRGYAYWQLAQEFCKAYDAGSAGNDPGLVLRASSDPNAKSVRSTVARTYQQIITDLSAAARLLPVEVPVKTRPGRAAAYAGLARAFLSMRLYDRAGLYADSGLRLNAVLLDYNTVRPGAGAAFQRFNGEVLLHTTLLSAPMLQPVRYLADTALYASYEPGDLRRALFFKAVPGSAYLNFNGSYDGTGTLFNGPATDELYLVRAEAAARAGRLAAALEDLNTLRKHRFLVSAYRPLSSGDAAEVLGWVLTERRKELLLRGLRWSDLRRLNVEPAYAKTLIKVINGKRYALPPGDARYVWPIPQAVIADTGIPQNP
jgi:hypothetical protein